MNQKFTAQTPVPVATAYEPAITRESYNGVQCVRLLDDMLTHREIECSGDIDAALINSLIAQLRYLARQDPDAEITMYINSYGGEVDSGLALYDVMQAVPCPIRTVCVGMAASMAAILFASGDTRCMLPHARVMIHDPLIGGGISGSALHIRGISDDLMHTREILCGILARHTGKTIEEIYEKTSTDTYFYAEEAIKYGLADQIITRL